MRHKIVNVAYAVVIGLLLLALVVAVDPYMLETLTPETRKLAISVYALVLIFFTVIALAGDQDNGT